MAHITVFPTPPETLLDQGNTWTEIQTFEASEGLADVLFGQVADPSTGLGVGFSTGTLDAASDTVLGTPDYGAGIAFYQSDLYINCWSGVGGISFISGMLSDISSDPDQRWYDYYFGAFHIHQRRALLRLYDGIRLVNATDGDYDTNSGWSGSPATFQGSGGVIDFGETVLFGDSTRDNVESGYARVRLRDNGSGKQELVITWDDQTTSVIKAQP